MLVSIVVPAYKQEKTIKKDIENIYEVMSSTRWDFEIVVVVDGFVDKTYQNAKKIIKKNIRVYGYEQNNGKGYAIRYGMARAKGDVISFIDAGMEINPNGISLLLEHMEWYKADIIVGSKRHPASKVAYPFLRKIYSWGYFILIKTLFGLKIKDTQAGLKVYRRKVLEDVLPRLVVKQYAFDIEILAVAHYLGYKRIYEAPVEISFDFSGSRFKRFLFMEPFIQNMLIDTVAIFYRMHILKYYSSENRKNWHVAKELQPRTVKSK